MWYNEFNSVFFLSMCTMVFTTLGLVVRYAFKSKCDSIECCGILKIHRNIEAEIELEEKLAEEKKENNSINNL